MLGEPNDSWAARTTAFSKALLDPAIGAPVGIGKHAQHAPKRFAVYRNNVTVSLMEALKSAFPSILALLGDETFSRLARAFVARHPPTSPMMQRYGDVFPTFLSELPALSELPFMPDVARVELCWLVAYHAADDAPLMPDDISVLSPEELMEQRFIPTSATSVIASDHSIYDLFNARFDWPTGQTDFNDAQAVLVSRQGFSVRVARLGIGHCAFFTSLIGGETLAQAIGTAMAEDDSFDAGAAIGQMLESHAFRTLTDKT
ncbi:MAG: DNA-binding domain-containing protein [Pseudomonadota bacterium]